MVQTTPVLQNPRKIDGSIDDFIQACKDEGVTGIEVRVFKDDLSKVSFMNTDDTCFYWVPYSVEYRGYKEGVELIKKPAEVFHFVAYTYGLYLGSLRILESENGRKPFIVDIDERLENALTGNMEYIAKQGFNTSLLKVGIENKMLVSRTKNGVEQGRGETFHIVYQPNLSFRPTI